MLASAPAATPGGSAVVKMKPGRKAAHEIAQRGRARDIAADHAERLGQRALDHGEPVAQAFALGDAAAARAVEADRVHLVEIGHGAMRVGDVAKFRDRRDVAIHRIDRLEGDQLGPAGIDCRQLAMQIVRIVVGEDALFGRLCRMPSIIEA